METAEDEEALQLIPARNASFYSANERLTSIDSFGIYLISLKVNEG